MRVPQVPQPDLTLWGACELFLTYPEIRKSPTRERHEACILNLVRLLKKDTPVKSIWIPALKKYQIDRRGEGAAASTVNWELSTSSRLFGVLIELQMVDANPARMVKRLSPKAEEREVYLAFSDVHRIVDLSPSWVRPVFLSAYFSGMRRGELLGLTWNQVDLKARIARLSPHDTKEGRSKRVPLRSEVVAVLEQCRRVRSLATDKVFLIDGRPPNGESIKNPWRRACKAVALVDQRPRFHDLRNPGEQTLVGQAWSQLWLRASSDTGTASGASMNVVAESATPSS